VGLRRKPACGRVLVAARLARRRARGCRLSPLGNTGAAVIACTQCFKAIQGVFKPALASVYPRQTEYPGQDQLALLLDVGATIRCDATELVQFAIMGARTPPRVESAEPTGGVAQYGGGRDQGGDILVEAYHRLKNCRGINFVGNI